MKDLMQRQINQELKKIIKLKTVYKPPAGWIRTIRESLGMTAEQLAKRLGVVQQRVSAIEKEEPIGSLKMKTLEEAAAALNCDLVYFFVPKELPEVMLKKRAYKLAQRMIERSTHSMDLEAQDISTEEKRQQIENLAKELLDKNLKALWNDK